MKLKTLKDLEKNADATINIHYWNKEERIIYTNAYLDALFQIKAEAIKWVKAYDFYLGEGTAFRKFFNITEEDLK